MSTAVILAGGESRRMGFDKQQLKIDEEYIIMKHIKTLETIFDQILIISNNHLSDAFELYEKVSVYNDVLKHKGPLGGIHSGLLHSFDDNIFVIACDMPEIDVSYINFLASFSHKYDAVVTSYGNWIEPFHAFYNKRIIRVIEEYLSQGRRNISGLLRRINAYYVPESTARMYTKNWSLFDNINTPKDLLTRKLTRNC